MELSREIIAIICVAVMMIIAIIYILQPSIKIDMQYEPMTYYQCKDACNKTSVEYYSPKTWADSSQCVCK